MHLHRHNCQRETPEPGVDNHPVHVLSNNTQLSPSAFIPFCDFGKNFKEFSNEVENFRVPVCNIFKQKIVHKQLCYEVDLEKIRDKNDSSSDLSSGFSFFIDLNEDREIKQKDAKKRLDHEYKSIVERMKKKDSYIEATIYLDTIGNNNKSENV